MQIVITKCDFINLSVEELANELYVGMEIGFVHYMLIHCCVDMYVVAFVNANHTWSSMKGEILYEVIINFLSKCEKEEGLSFHVFNTSRDLYDWMKEYV